mmetsp:Transcript_102600/g.289917  ORF Transcript_102600/g.289917 Transcript_102600/m.289917 type:complete len:343 (-) Transcript_102600:79-1107(-)
MLPNTLPPGWSLEWSRTHAREYYYHDASGQVSWDCPQADRVPPKKTSDILLRELLPLSSLDATKKDGTIDPDGASSCLSTNAGSSCGADGGGSTPLCGREALAELVREEEAITAALTSQSLRPRDMQEEKAVLRAACAHSRRRLRFCCDVGAQTELVAIQINSASASDSRQAWSCAERAAQEEALRSVQQLGTRIAVSFEDKAREEELKAKISETRARRRTAESMVATEQGRRKALEKQVGSLEAELVGKASALHVAQCILAQRDSGLHRSANDSVALLEADPKVLSPRGSAAALLQTRLGELDLQLKCREARETALLEELKRMKAEGVQLNFNMPVCYSGR